MSLVNGRHKIASRLAMLFFCLGLVAVVVAAAAAQAGGNWMAPPAGDFPLAGGNYMNQRYSTLDQINTSNIRNLGGAWMLRVEEGNRTGARQLDATPAPTPAPVIHPTTTYQGGGVAPGAQR